MDINKDFHDEKLYEKTSPSFYSQKFLSLIGAELVHVEDGKVKVTCEFDEKLTQQHGRIHGGVITTIADVSCGYAAMSCVPEGVEILSVEFKINLMRPVMTDGIYAIGEVIKAGKTLLNVESTVYDSGSGKVVAKMLSTMIKSPA